MANPNPSAKAETAEAAQVGNPETASWAATAGPESAAFDPSSFPVLAPPQQPDELGRLGRYRVLALLLLGAGGMGVVFQAEDTLLRRQVALKALHARLAADPQARSRFLREARAQAHVEHDNIIPIFDGVEDGDSAYIAMPLLKGTTLAAALRANPKLPLGVVLRIAREIAEGLAAAHAAGLVHRDIKPSNVWLEESRGAAPGRCRILDFGLARTEDSGDAEPSTAEDAFVGTPEYMSPASPRRTDRRPHRSLQPRRRAQPDDDREVTVREEEHAGPAPRRHERASGGPARDRIRNSRGTERPHRVVELGES